MKVMTENFCVKCDNVIHALVEEDDLKKGVVGRVRCSCGEINLMCNECSPHGDCDNCPLINSKIVKGE